MKNFIRILYSGFLFLTAFSLISCGGETKDDHHPPKVTKEAAKYPCAESDIKIEAAASSFDNLRGEYGTVLTGKLTCGSGAPVTNGRLNIQFPERNTDLNVSTDNTGAFKLQVSKMKEPPTDKIFKVTLLTAEGDNKTQVTKEFKAPAPENSK
jgi:hypothetical protein